MCETKNPKKEQVNEYTMKKREIYKKFTNLSKQELNTKNNKNPYVRNDVMTIIIKQCRGYKTGIRAINGSRKKLMIPDFEIPKCPEFKVKSKIRKLFKKHNPLEEYSVRINEIDPYFYKHYEKKIQVDKNGCKYILFRIDVYIYEFSLAVEIDENGDTDRDLIFEKKRQEALQKKLGCKFITINTSTSNAKNGYDLDYDVGNIEAFIDEFKNKKNKRTRSQNKRIRRQKKKLNQPNY